jgi:site-specific recombinase XerD
LLPLTTRQFNRAVHAAAEMAEIKKRVTPHTLRLDLARYESIVLLSGDQQK